MLQLNLAAGVEAAFYPPLVGPAAIAVRRGRVERSTGRPPVGELVIYDIIIHVMKPSFKGYEPQQVRLLPSDLHQLTGK